MARINTALKREAVPESVAPSEPYRLGELTIDYAERRVFLAGQPVPMTKIQYNLLFELSANTGRVLNHEHLLQRVRGPGQPGHSGPIRTAVTNIRHKLRDDADSPTYIFNRPRVGYLVPRGETQQ